MGLRQRIEVAYYDLKNALKENKKIMESRLSNQETVHKKIKELKNDLYQFADNFDKQFINLKILKVESIDDMYNDIRNKFVKRISDERDHFIYSCKKERSLEDAKVKYSNAIKTFNTRYAKLLPDFDKSRNLIKFFEETAKDFSGASSRYDNWDLSIFNLDIVRINEKIEEFMFAIFDSMTLELKSKEKILVAKDDEYFYDVDKTMEELQNNPEKYQQTLEKLAQDKQTCEKSKTLQKTLPTYWRDLTMEYRKLQDKHPIETVKDEVKIFPTKESPLPIEVKQAGIGDCYLMATLIALAKNNKKAITDCFVQGLDKIENEKNIIIRFFGYKKLIREEIKISVDKSKVIFPRHIRNYALWPKLMEKAYAVYRKEAYEYGFSDNMDFDYFDGKIRKTGKKLDSGSPQDVMIAITGNKPRSSTEKHKDESKFESERIIDTVEKKLRSGRSLVCDFKKQFKIRDAKNKEEIEIHSTHAYAIVGIEKTKGYIRLIEPNKAWGRKYSAKPINTDRLEPANDGGHIAMKFDDFKNNVLRISYTGNKIR